MIYARVYSFESNTEYANMGRKPNIMDRVFRKLHLGCFDQVYNGWLNTDFTPHIFISRIPGLALILFKIGLLSQQRYKQHKQGVFRAIRYLNVTKRFPYADATFDYIFSLHLLEHLYPYQ